MYMPEMIFHFNWMYVFMKAVLTSVAVPASNFKLRQMPVFISSLILMGWGHPELEAKY